MFRLRLFGPPLLEGPDGPVDGRVAQRRRVALLAVLALADRRILTRDKLLAMFWPESDAERARHSLADTVYVVRKALGDDALLSTSDDLHLNPDRVATDVEAFEEALADGRLERAVALHADPLLDGFHVGDAPDFEHWLHVERTRLAALHAEALEALAGRATDAGRPDEAVTWWRQRAASDPLDTRVAMELMRALGAAGNRAAALRHAELHRRVLRQRLDVEPDPELLELRRELARRGAGGRTAADRASPPPGRTPSRASTSPAADAEVGEEPGPEVGARPDSDAGASETSPAGASGTSPAGASGTSPAGTSGTVPAGAASAKEVRDPGRRRGGPWLAGAFVGAALVALLLTSGVLDPAPSYVDDRIVVLAFEPPGGDPTLEGPGRLAAEVVIQGLDRARLGDVVLPFEMTAAEVRGEADDAPLSVAEATREFGAGLAVTGTVRSVGDSLVFHARLTEAEGGRVVAALEPVRGSASAPGRALERLRQRAVGAVAAHLGREAPEHPFVVPTPTWESYRLADHATRLFLRREFCEAARLYRRAYELDTTAVGYRLWEAVAYSNSGACDGVSEILEELRPRRHQLSRFDAAQFDWLEALVTGDRRAALEAARAARREAPHSGLGGYQLGVELYRTGSASEALGVLRSLDPERGWLGSWGRYWYRLAAVHHLLGQHEEELEVAREGYERFPTWWMLEARVRALAALGRVQEAEGLVTGSAWSPADHLSAAEALHRHGHAAASVRVAEQGLSVLAASLEGGGRDPEGALHDDSYLEARLLAMARRPGAARAILEKLVRLDPENPRYLGWLGVVEARSGRDAEARSRVARLQDLEGEPNLTGRETAYRAAVLAELAEDPGRVRRLMERAHREGRTLPAFHYTPLFDPVRDHPAVRDFLRMRD